MRKKLRGLATETPQPDSGNEFARMMEAIGKKFFGLSQSKIAEELGFSEGNLRNMIRERRVNYAALSALAKRGVDVNYILTGSHSSSVASSVSADLPEQLDPLMELKKPPENCPNHKLCGRLAMLIVLQRELFSSESLSSESHLEEVRAAIAAVTKVKRARTEKSVVA